MPDPSRELFQLPTAEEVEVVFLRDGEGRVIVRAAHELADVAAIEAPSSSTTPRPPEAPPARPAR